MLGFIPCGFILSVGLTSANIAGHTKKLTTQAIFFICYSVGSTSHHHIALYLR